MTPHFLTGAELTAAELDELLDRAVELKREPLRSNALEGRSVALIFQKPSTRTRLSFEVGVHELGGQPLILRSDEMQLSRGEALRDTATVLGRHVAAVGLRTGSEETLEELARRSPVPVINMLSPEHHPCQALADLLTLREAFGTLAGLRIAYVGDGNNVARSLAMLGTLAGVDVAIASPAGYSLEELPLSPATGDRDARTRTHARPSGRRTPCTPTCGSSMGDEAEADAAPRRRWPPTSSTTSCSTRRADGAFAMHDLPAHPGEEITAEVLYGERQRIWDQAENRRHAQKALLELLLAAPSTATRRAGGSLVSEAPPGPERGGAHRGRARGDELELEVDSLAFGGEGVARLGEGGYVVFVAGAIPGDRVRAVVHKRKRSYAHARTLEVLRPSPERIAAAGASTPGVPWQVLPYERQLEIKRDAGRRGAAADRRPRGLRARADRPGRRAVALPQQARVLLRRGRRAS